MKRSRNTLALSIAMFLLAGCGDDGEGAGSSATPTFSATSTPAATATRTATATATLAPTPDTAVTIIRPEEHQLSLAGDVPFEMQAPRGIDPAALHITLDGTAIGADYESATGRVAGVAPAAAEGVHVLRAELSGEPRAEASFETVAIENPGECEILNRIHCLLPYPTSRFLSPADTPTGVRLTLPAAGMPRQFNVPLSPEPYTALDGYSPGTQIVMHFPGNVDIVASGAPRLLEQTRTTDLRSLDADSPTILLDADSGERILHFVENDARAANEPDRQTLLLRPARSLLPGHRYIVAVRNLVHPGGSPVVAEPQFAALRDRRPTDIAALAARREVFEDIFTRLASAGVARESLVLAFDFRIQSEQGLTAHMLFMRDYAFQWLDGEVSGGRQTFTVERVDENDCAVPGTAIWRRIEGTFQVPLFLTSDPETDAATPGTLNLVDNVPAQTGFTNPPFTIGIPCSVLDPAGGVQRPLLLGHGLFGTGRDFVDSVLGAVEEDGSLSSGEFDFIVGATNWRGLSALDITPLNESFIVANIVFNLNNFTALPDRLRQGQLNTLVLGHMMKTGAFNLNPAFRLPDNSQVLPGAAEEMYYLGGSLGGIMGLMFSALSPDIVKADIVVGATNFAFLVQRATPFLALEGALRLSGLTDPLETAVGISILGELWSRGEPIAYATHITSNPFPGTNTKQILMTTAWLDQQVSNTGSEIAARTLGIPNLKPGSLVGNLPQIPDAEGPLTSAFVMHDTGAFDLSNPAHAPFIPPLANTQAQPNDCDPHGAAAFSPAALAQVAAYFQPGGTIVNFCSGDCDAQNPDEIPFGMPAPCNPLAQ